MKLTTYVRPYAEWKPRPDLSVRLEVPLATEPNVRLRDTLQIFPGPRSAGGLPDIQDRQFHFPSRLVRAAAQDLRLNGQGSAPPNLDIRAFRESLRRDDRMANLSAN